eukprot:g74114.t1
MDAEPAVVSSKVLREIPPASQKSSVKISLVPSVWESAQLKKPVPTVLGFLRGTTHDLEDDLSQKTSWDLNNSRHCSPTVMFHDCAGFENPLIKYSPNGRNQANHDVEGTASDSSDVPSSPQSPSQRRATVKPENDIDDGSTTDDHCNSTHDQSISQDQENESAPAEKRRKRRSEARRKRRQNRRKLWKEFFQMEAELQRQAAASGYYYNPQAALAASMLPPGAYMMQQTPAVQAQTHLQLQLERQIQYLQQQLAQAQWQQQQAPHAPPANVQTTQQLKRQWGLPALVIKESDERRNVAPRLSSPILPQQRALPPRRVESCRDTAALSQSMCDLQLRGNREHTTLSRFASSSRQMGMQSGGPQMRRNQSMGDLQSEGCRDMAALSQSMCDLQLRGSREHTTLSREMGMQSQGMGGPQMRINQSMGDLQSRGNREHTTVYRGSTTDLPSDFWKHDTKIPPAARVSAPLSECSPAFAPQQTKMYIPLRVVNLQD